jgi:hypothetical protein
VGNAQQMAQQNTTGAHQLTAQQPVPLTALYPGNLTPQQLQQHYLQLQQQQQHLQHIQQQIQQQQQQQEHQQQHQHGMGDGESEFFIIVLYKELHNFCILKMGRSEQLPQLSLWERRTVAAHLQTNQPEQLIPTLKLCRKCQDNRHPDPMAKEGALKWPKGKNKTSFPFDGIIFLQTCAIHSIFSI